jgi:hypothetical protein
LVVGMSVSVYASGPPRAYDGCVFQEVTMELKPIRAPTNVSKSCLPFFSRRLLSFVFQHHHYHYRHASGREREEATGLPARASAQFLTPIRRRYTSQTNSCLSYRMAGRRSRMGSLFRVSSTL